MVERLDFPVLTVKTGQWPPLIAVERWLVGYPCPRGPCYINGPSDRKPLVSRIPCDVRLIVCSSDENEEEEGNDHHEEDHRDMPLHLTDRLEELSILLVLLSKDIAVPRPKSLYETAMVVRRYRIIIHDQMAGLSSITESWTFRGSVYQTNAFTVKNTAPASMLQRKSILRAR